MPATHYVSAGASIGSNYQNDSFFWGLSADYSRLVAERWSVSASVTFDRDREPQPAMSDKVVDTYALIVTGNYQFAERWSITTGIARDFADNDNPEEKLKVAWGDWSTGVAFGYAPNDSVGLSFSWEWNITDREPAISMDVTYQWGF